MKIVIAGGTGLIGRALSAHFIAVGDEVTVLTRRRPGSPGLVEGAHRVVWDAIERGEWTRCLDGADVVINLTGEGIADGRWTDQRKTALVLSRVASGRLLADAVCGVGVPPALFVQASGVGYYGTGTALRDERSPVGNDFLATLAREWEASSVALPPVTRRIVARFGVVLSRDGGVLRRIVPPFRWLMGHTFGDGAQWFPWVHIDDAVSAIEHLAFETDVQGAVNIVAPEAATNRDFASALGRTLRRPVWLHVPRKLLTTMLGEQATLVLDGQQVRPRVLEENGFIFNFPGVELALLDLLRG
jgi:uncharacterized protein (TIGR01777 family)